MHKLLILFIIIFQVGCSSGDPSEVYLNKGLARYDIKDYAGALLYFDKSIELKPKFNIAYAFRGFVKNFTKDYQSAVLDFNEAIKRPDEPSDKFIGSLFLGRATSKIELRNYKEALEDIKKSIELNPKDPTAYFLRGRINNETMKYEEAKIDFDKALELFPDFIPVYLERGVVKYELSDYNGSISDLNKYINVDSLSDRAYVYRGLSKFKLGDNDSGCSDITKSIGLGNEVAVLLKTKFCN